MMNDDALRHIARELHALRRELQTLQRESPSSRRFIEQMLRRRGITSVKYTSQQQTLLPVNCPKKSEDALYRLMKKYSFRIFLRDLLKHRDHLTPADLTRYCSEEVALEYLDTLVKYGFLKNTGPWEYRFPPGKTPKFGRTLEWFVAQVMRREFTSPATWGTSLKNSERGGDYDVMTSIEGSFAYIEVKSSPPKHIDIPEIRAFVDRVQELRPDFSIFLEDTHLRMKDKLAVMFTEEMQRRYGASAPQRYPVQRLHDEIFCINKSIFITNTKPDLITNISVCLKHVLAKGLEPRPETPSF